MPRVLFLILLLGVSFARADETGIEKARRQFIDFYTGRGAGFAMEDTNEATAEASKATRYAVELKPDGSWPDIDYGSKARSSWAPMQHVSRMATIAAEAVHSPDRAKLLPALHRGFAYWITTDPKCVNWWYNQIGVPKQLGICGVLLGNELTAEERAYLANVIAPRTKIGMTGQNKLWLAGNTLSLGLVFKDESMVRTAANTIWNEIRTTTEEGIQPDFSFHQHGPQQQFGNYGLAFAVEVSHWATILSDTPWKLSDDKLGIYRQYLLDGQGWISWRGLMDIGSCGRQFMPGSAASKTRNAGLAMNGAATFDREAAAAYQAFLKRNQPNAPNDLTGDRFFWRSDYFVHRTSDTFTTLKMSSNRVIGAEIVNDENLSGYHLGDGMLCHYRSGREYEDIFPVWDWRKVPGTTAAQGELPRSPKSGVKRDFVGAVTDGTASVAVLDYQRDGVSAHKAWFFNGSTVIALGSDIRSSGKDPIVTTLEQCLGQGAIRSSKGNVTVGLQPATEWIEHGGFRYTFLEPAPFTIAAGPVTGNWSRIYRNPSTPNADVTRPVFTLSLDHGRQPSSAHYAYAVTTSGTTPLARLLVNSPNLQAVQLSPTLIGVAFWSAGTFRDLTVDQPCLVLFDSEPRHIRLADPTQKLKHLTFKVGEVSRTIVLPSGGMAGSSVE